MFDEHLFFVIRAGFLRNPLPFDAISYKQKITLRINSCVIFL